MEGGGGRWIWRQSVCAGSLAALGGLSQAAAAHLHSCSDPPSQPPLAGGHGAGPAGVRLQRVLHAQRPDHLPRAAVHVSVVLGVRQPVLVCVRRLKRSACAGPARAAHPPRRRPGARYASSAPHTPACRCSTDANGVQTVDQVGTAEAPGEWQRSLVWQGLLVGCLSSPPPCWRSPTRLPAPHALLPPRAHPLHPAPGPSNERRPLLWHRQHVPRV